MDAQLDRYDGFDTIATFDLLGRDYNFDAPPASTAELIVAPSQGGHLVGSNNTEVFAGSDLHDVFTPGGGSNHVYSGSGNDRFLLDADGIEDLLFEESGYDTIEFTSVISINRVAFRTSQDGQDLILMIDGKAEARIVDAFGAGSVESVVTSEGAFNVTSLALTSNQAPDAASRHIDYFGEFGGGSLVSAFTSDVNQDSVTYSIVAVEGAYSDQNWTVDKATGVIIGGFFKPDKYGSESTIVKVLASDNIDTAVVEVSIRWAYSLELNPELSKAFELNPIYESGVIDEGFVISRHLDPNFLLHV